jgi:hypothetical protein
MEQIYYTQEGHGYVLRTVSQNPRAFSTPGTTRGVVQVRVNNTATIYPDPPYGANSTININTTKKIIPVQAFAVITGNVTPVVDIASVYYFPIRGIEAPFVNSYEHFRSLGKTLPLTTRIYDDTEENYHHNFMYGQAVYNDSDFIDPTSGITFVFVNRQSMAMTNGTIDFHYEIPVGDYYQSMIFTYFEML